VKRRGKLKINAKFKKKKKWMKIKKN